ncbi:MAG TPA: hypothetical protein VFO36_13445 [Nitrospiraceae bacterium]|nr:hypothetical protein [Nitrospiraceae bacterium]
MCIAEDGHGPKSDRRRLRPGVLRPQMGALRDAEALLQAYAMTGGNVQFRSWATTLIRLVQQHQRQLSETASAAKP